jgi:dipeptidyl-peptidase-3
VARGPGPAYHHAVHPRQLSARPLLRLPVTASLALAALLFGACDKGVRPPEEKKQAPRVVDVQPASPPFKVTVESFADVRILRYQVPGFADLSKNQKLLLYYLQEASLSGRDITYDQHYEHNLAIRRTLEAILDSYRGERSGQAWDALSTYAKRVWFSNGIHHHYSSKKFLPEGLTREEFAAFVRGADPKKLPLAEKESVDALIEKLTPVMFDPKIAERAVNKDPTADPVKDSANHFYVGLNRDEVAAYMRARQDPHDESPLSYGLNSQLRKREDGSIEERFWHVGGMYDKALAECVKWLEKAVTVAENDAQRTALQRLITYYRTGSLEDWDQYSIAWVADTKSKIDLIHGFIESYGDALDYRANYEALVELEDELATQRIRTLGNAAQWFEDNSPIAEAHRKKSVVGITARVIQAVMAAGDAAPAMASGVNLPNASWVRKAHGSKSVTLGNILTAYDAANRDNGVLEEFAAGPREIERAKSSGALAQALVVDMHEVIGHASGQLMPGVAEASETLKQYASTLEEGRADLVALYYILDPKLVELKVMPSLEVGRAAYDSYIRGALLVQLARIPLGEGMEEAHMRNRLLIARWALEHGAGEGVIEKLERNGKTFFAVRDYVKLRKLFGQLLKEIQRIKSEGDFTAARDLVETYGVKLDPELHKQVRERYDVLKVAPYAGFIQPELVPVLEGDQIVDVRIEYPEDFAAQELRYAAKYSFLPTYN